MNRIRLHNFNKKWLENLFSKNERARCVKKKKNRFKIVVQSCVNDIQLYRNKISHILLHAKKTAIEQLWNARYWTKCWINWTKCWQTLKKLKHCEKKTMHWAFAGEFCYFWKENPLTRFSFHIYAKTGDVKYILSRTGSELSKINGNIHFCSFRRK